VTTQEIKRKRWNLWRQMNLEKIRERDRLRKRKFRAENREKYRAMRRAEYRRKSVDPGWAQKRREQVRESYRRNLESERERHRLKQQYRRAVDGDRIRALHRDWYVANAERVIAKVKARKERPPIKDGEWSKIETKIRKRGMK